jgi:hypothetical protein
LGVGGHEEEGKDEEEKWHGEVYCGSQLFLVTEKVPSGLTSTIYEEQLFSNSSKNGRLFFKSQSRPKPFSEKIFRAVSLR